jgi:transcriptional regulator GlxA family with amidase domain
LRFDLGESTLTKVREAGQAVAAKATWHEHQAVAALTDCLVEAIRAAQAAQASQPAVRHEPPANPTLDPFQSELGRVLEAIEKAPYDGWTVATLAERCHLTADHFTKRFRTALAMGPQDYLLRTRMRAAAQLLAADENCSIKEVADAAGYATVHSFSRAFRQVTGTSPGRFRRQSPVL